MELNNETLFASFESKAQFTLEENDGDIVNPSFHMGSARIFAIDSVANNVKFSQESTMNALPTLKNIPIVALYKDDEQNFGDHEIIRDVDGIRYGTYPIGMIPESAEQWIEEVQTEEGTKQYLCSDILLWKRQKKEFQLIKSQGTFSVSMEVGMVDYEFNANKVCNVNEFYFTAIAVLGNGVKPAFKEACINFHKIGVFQDMMLDLKEYMQQFEGGNSMGGNQIADEPITDFEEGQEPQQEQVNEQPKQEEQQEVKDEPNYKELLEKAEADYGRTIADLNKENDALKVQMESVRTELEGKVASLEEQLKTLTEFKAQVEQEQRAKAIEGVKERFSELAEDDEFKSLITDLENGRYTPEQAEDKCYAIIGRQAKAKRQQKVAPAPKITINANHKEQPKTKDSKYGGLLFK